MRLIDAEKIMVHRDMIHNINGCMMVRVEDIQRIITEQSVAYDLDRVRSILEENKEIIEDKEGTNHIVIPAFTADYIVRKDGWIKE